MRKAFFLIPVLLVAVGLARSALFTVDRTEFVYLTQFGRLVATFDGADGVEAGLHVKWPWPVQSVQRLDRRLQYFDLPATEVLTREAHGQEPSRNKLNAYVTILLQNQPFAAAACSSYFLTAPQAID